MRALLSSALLITTFLFSFTSALASGNNLFRVGQTKFFLQTSTGKPLTEVLNVSNLTSSKIDLNLSWIGYNLEKNQIIDQKLLISHSIDFFNVDTASFSLEPFANQSLNLSFAPNENLPAGDYYGQLTIEANSQKIPIDFTVRILGQLKEGLVIESIKNSGQNLVLKIKNNGNITSNFSVSTKTERFLASTLKIKSKDQSIRAGEIKQVYIKHPNLLPGYYQTAVSLTYGQKNYQVSQIFSFWIYPLVFALGLIVIVSFILGYYFIKKKNRVTPN